MPGFGGFIWRSERLIGFCISYWGNIILIFYRRKLKGEMIVCKYSCIKLKTINCNLTVELTKKTHGDNVSELLGLREDSTFKDLETVVEIEHELKEPKGHTESYEYRPIGDKIKDKLKDFFAGGYSEEPAPTGSIGERQQRLDKIKKLRDMYLRSG